MLPKIQHPTFEVTIPSTKVNVRIRPMLVKEEKMLLTAKEGNSPSEIWIAVRDVVNNCLVVPMKIDQLTMFDLDYLFIKVRGASMGNKIDLTFTDREDSDKNHAFSVDLSTVEVKWPEVVAGENPMVIKIGDTGSLELKYPTVAVYDTPAFGASDLKEQDIFDELVYDSLDKYFEGETATPFKGVKREEVKEFIDNLDVKTYDKIRTFISTLPTVYHEVPYKNSKDEDKTLKLASLTDFFAFV